MVWLAGVVFVIVLILVLFFFFVTTGPNNEKYYVEQVTEGKLANPVGNLTVEEAMTQFNETFIYYILYQIGAYNLHNPPLSDSKPKIEIIVDDMTFNSIIDEGVIFVSKGEIEDEDIVINTNREEAVKMLKAKEYISVSFEEGRSWIDLKASKTILFSKGYLGLYNGLTGESVTGNVVKIYAD